MSDRFHIENKREDTQTVRIEDASSITAKSLPQQLGSDIETLLQGKVDVRRLSNIDEVERIWITWFMNLPDDVGGQFSRKFCLEYLNLSMSLGGNRAKQLIDMMLASSGGTNEKNPEKKGIYSRIKGTIFGDKEGE